MRKLNIEDAFTFSEIVDKLGIEADLNHIADEGSKRGQEWVGGQIALLLLKKLHKGKVELINFLASYAEIKPEELSVKPISYLKDILLAMSKDESFDSFFPQGLSSEKKSLT